MSATKEIVLKRLIEKNVAPRAAAAMGALVVLPSVFGGLAFDDFVHRLQARGHLIFGATTRVDLFRFADGDHEHVRIGMEHGLFPWFAREDVKIAFFRPLASVSHYLDFSLLGLPPWLMHVESIALYALLVFLAARFFQRVISHRGAAGLAALIYAVNPAHALPAGWIANRNALIASVFGVLALLAHDRARREGWRAGRVLAPTCLALALLGGELGLGAFAYLVAHAITLDRGTRTERVRALVPHAAVVALWQLAYRALGYGVIGSAFYLDPVHAPAAFAGKIAQRLPALLAGGLALLPPEVLVFASPATATWYSFLAVAIVAAGAWAMWPILRRDASGRFLALGALLAAFPACTTHPAGRLLILAGLGLTGLVAKLAADVVLTVERRPFARAVGFAMSATHLALGVVLTPLGSIAPALLDGFARATATGLPLPADLAGKSAVVVRSPSYLIAGYRFGIPRGEDVTTPSSLRLLAMGWGDTRIRRIDAQTLEVRIERGLLNEPLGGGLFRDTPIPAGAVFTLSDMTTTILEAHDGAPIAATFRFATPLDDPSRAWFAWDGGRFVRFAPPEVGADVVLHD